MFICQNSLATATLWLPATSDIPLEDAASSFRRTILEIADADVDIRRFASESEITSSPENLAVILAPSDLCDFVRPLFADELAKIADTDGFAYGLRDGKLYIVGATAFGVYYGVHRFLEENADVLWVRGDKTLGTLFERHRTIELTSTEACEVPAFRFRGWNMCGQGSLGLHHDDDATFEMLGRNGGSRNYGSYRRTWRHFGIRHFGGSEYGGAKLNLNEEFAESRPDFFMTNPDGSVRLGKWESYINYFNLECAEVIGGRICKFFDAHPDVESIDFSMPDNTYFVMAHGGVHLEEMPYTMPDGRVITPDKLNFKSTVYWCFMNHVAKIVAKRHPGKLITSLSYIYSEHAPEVDLEDNLVPTFAPITGDDHYPIASDLGSNAQVKLDIEGWSKKTKNLAIYNYYGCFKGEVYSRPIAKKIQADFKWYRDLGVVGLCPEGHVDSSIHGSKSNRLWSLNSLYLWQAQRLMWNPDADLDALTRRYCRLAYGKAAPQMEEYYRLIQRGWDETPGTVWYTTGGDLYIKQMIIGAGIADEVMATLRKALDVLTPEDGHQLRRARIQPIYDILSEQIAMFRNFKNEDAYAKYTDRGEDVVMSDAALLSLDGAMDGNPWDSATPLVVFKSHLDMSDCDEAAQLEARLLWDDTNLYIRYRMYDDRIGTEADPTASEKYNPMGPADSFFKDSDIFAENYIVGNMTNMHPFYCYYSDVSGYEKNHFRYISDGSIHLDKVQLEWSVRTVVNAEECYFVHAQVIPFASLDVTSKTALPGGMLVLNTKRYGIQSWTGGGLWNSGNFRRFELVK